MAALELDHLAVPLESFPAIISQSTAKKSLRQNRRGRDAKATGDLPRRNRRCKLQSNNFARLAHRSSLRWHRSLPRIAKGATETGQRGPPSLHENTSGQDYLVTVGDIISL
jgi:hypothetical protein